MSNHPHPIHKFDRPEKRPSWLHTHTIRTRPEGERKLSRREKRILKQNRRNNNVTND